MCVECFAHVEEDKNSSSHGHIVGTGGNAKSIKCREQTFNRGRLGLKLS